MIALQLFVIEEGDDNRIFGILLGVYLMIRGAVHFFGVSEFKEKSDVPLYLFHVAALIVGSYVFFNENFTAGLLIHIILFFSVVSGGYLIFQGYKGYRSYRYQKTLTMPDEKVKEDKVEKRVPVSESEVVEKEIEEPQPLEDHVS